MDNIIHKFYSSFKKLDAEAMVSCYHKDIVFSDPAFGKLKGDRAGNMWRMLLDSQKNKDFKISYDRISLSGTRGTAHWEASYTFSKTGRTVNNVITADFVLKDGLIIVHTDRFDLHRWARQAFGLKGLVFGGTDFFQKKLQKKTNALLSEYEKKLSSLK
jgi:hypothetical protein